MLTDERQDIKISSKAEYQDPLSQVEANLYMFSYTITIENESKFPVQLLDRHWEIFDSQGEYQVVDGEGVIGKRPILQPNESFSYTSGCQLNSDYGKMKGFYSFLNLDNEKEFIVDIPEFTLLTPFKLN